MNQSNTVQHQTVTNSAI